MQTLLESYVKISSRLGCAYVPNPTLAGQTARNPERDDPGKESPVDQDEHAGAEYMSK